MNLLYHRLEGAGKGWLPGLALGLLLGFSTNTSYAALAQAPLFLTIGVDPNILFEMSIETPMGGAAYNDQPDGGSCGGRVVDGGEVGVCYFNTQAYLGYFDPNKCYTYNSVGGYFQPDSDTINAKHECSEKFSGNFMNWATMTAMDMFTWTMTGGNRVDDGADDTTVIRRTRKTNNDGWFPHKLITNLNNVSPSTVTPWNDAKIFIYNTDFGVKFGTSRGGSEKGTMNVNVRVCDKTKTLETNCVAYDSGNYYKPEGLVQKNADHMRFGVTSYTNTNGNDISGGVLRSNMKYVGTLMPDGSGGVKANGNKEIAADGTIVLNSNPDDAKASNVTQSGVIPYLNKFSDASYKGNDPISELFYESLRYFKHLGPTPEYLGGTNGGFPILGSDRWQDPITARCQKNFIVGINDANPWMDKKLPGTYFTNKKFNGQSISQDYGEPSNPDSAINVKTLTNKVGDLEGLTNTSQCIGCTADSCDMAANNKNIPGLGEVMGTCPYPAKYNSYYIAGLAYYANTQDLRSDFTGKQTVKTFMADTQEYSASPLVGKMNMLWLAGKYGGFNDFDSDGVPDGPVIKNNIVVTPSEWDTDGNGEPDNYVLVTKPEKLVASLNKAFTTINDQVSSASAVAANSTRLDSGTVVYQAKFNSIDWSGQLQAYTVNINTGALTPVWEASTKLPAHGDRKIYTFNPLAKAGERGVLFQWANLNKDTDNPAPVPFSQQHYLNNLSGVDDGNGSLRVSWLRGDDTHEQKKTGGIFRNRSNVLGDITNSDPIYVGIKDFGYSTLPESAGGKIYSQFLSSVAARRPMIYVGANDGMFHGFDAGTSANGGKEILAYIPNALFPELSKLTSPNYSHQYYVDGKSAVGDVFDGTAWRTELVGTTGSGGRAVFALDVTNPDQFAAANTLWEFTNANDTDLGFTLAQPDVVRMQDGHWAAIVANGYNSDNGHAVLFVLDATTGAVLQKIDTGVGTVARKNGLSSPIAVDTNGDLSVDTIYAGDLYGDLWKFDVSGAAGSWPVPAAPLFVACTTTGVDCASANRQPITAKPNIGPVGGLGTDQNGVGKMVYFGTGKYFETGDNIVGNSPQVQTFYGLWDKGAAITDRAKLLDQTIEFQGTATTVGGTALANPIRIVSKNTICYAATSAGCDATSGLKSGWAFNLIAGGSAQGERLVSFPLVRRGLVIFPTLIPETDPCSSGGQSYLMELDALSGGRTASPPFDVDDNGVVDDKDKVDINGVIFVVSGADLGIGIMTTPAVVEGTSLDHKYFDGTKDAEMAHKAEPGGGGGAGGAGTRRSWQQLR